MSDDEGSETVSEVPHPPDDSTDESEDFGAQVLQLLPIIAA